MSQQIPQGTFLGHPKGLFLLFTTEMWERFSYYGMRALLVLTMVAATDAANPGFGMTTAEALKLYAYYTSLVYLTPIFGGWLADTFIGQRRAVILGGALMSVAQFVLFAATPHSLSLFYLGLGILIIGNGFFKPNISTMVGDLYEQGDARRDSAFSIFYMGINLGAFIAPLICSTLGEDPAWGWRYGYLAAGIGMALSVVIQLFFAQRFLGDVGVVAGAKRSLDAAGGKKQPLTKVELDRLRVILTLFIFVVMFWLAFEQAGGLMNIFAQDKTDRMIGNSEVPAGWFQSLNAMFILIFAPVFSILWVKLNKIDKNPDAPIKIVVGLFMTAIGFGFLVAGIFQMQTTGDAKASMIWLVLAYMFHTLGELCISPVGLSLMTKLAPMRLASLVMGIWFLMPALAQLLGGLIGAFSEQAGEYESVRHFAANLGIRAEDAGILAIFGSIAIFLCLFAIILWFISGKLVLWMHGAEKFSADTTEAALNEELNVVGDHEALRKQH
ncbi:peptide MFS transporter [Gallaecimonas pentaromativorans]|uniref:peptide MFS transporter n=1 Tax=Gallaecimonas pentaromativorans TaxID=584787 RepID=UPI003A8F5BA4